MANQSDKKLQKQKENTAPIYLAVVTLFTMIYGLFLFWSIFQDTSVKFKIFLFIIYTTVNIYSYNNVVKGLEFGIDYSTYVDILAINNLFLVLSMFTYKIFYLLYIIPIYIVFLLMKWVWGFMNTDYKKETDIDEPKKDKNRKEKVKYKTIK